MAKFVDNISNQFDLGPIVHAVNDINNGHHDIIRMYGEDGTQLMPDEFIKVYGVEAGLKDPLWDNYTLYPHTHFPEAIVHFLDNLLGTICTQCWINRVRPGVCAIRHKDFDNREDKLAELGVLERYSLFLGKPEIGHVFMVEGTAYYMEEHGNLYKWDDHMSEHAGANAGLKHKNLFIYRGLRLYKPLDFEYVWQTDNDSVLLKLKDGTII